MISMATTLKTGIKSDPFLISQKLDFVNEVDADTSISFATRHPTNNPDLCSDELKITEQPACKTMKWNGSSKVTLLVCLLMLRFLEEKLRKLH
jgi:hypothetical protein